MNIFLAPFLLLFLSVPFNAAKEDTCTEYTTKTVKYVHYSTSSIYETSYVTVSGPAGGTATTTVTKHASPAIVTIHAAQATNTVTSVVLSTATVKGSATATVTTTKTETGATALSLVTETKTAAENTQTVLFETMINSAGRATPISIGNLAVLAVAGAAILLIH